MQIVCRSYCFHKFKRPARLRSRSRTGKAHFHFHLPLQTKKSTAACRHRACVRAENWRLPAIWWGFITGIAPVPFFFLSTLPLLQNGAHGGWGGGVRNVCQELELDGERCCVGGTIFLFDYCPIRTSRFGGSRSCWIFLTRSS